MSARRSPDAPRYWRVSPKFWTTVQHEEWSDDARLLGLYLLTCQHRTAEGLFRLPKSYICEDLDWTPERLAQPFAELLAKGFIEHDEKARWLLIVAALKYQRPENPNQVTSALRRITECPATSPLTSSFRRLAQRYAQGLAEGLPQGFGQPFGEPQSQPQALEVVGEPLAEARFIPGTGPVAERRPAPTEAAADTPERIGHARSMLRNGIA